MADPSTKFNPIDLPCIYTTALLVTGFMMSKTFDDRLAFVTDLFVAGSMVILTALIVITVEVANRAKVAPLLTNELHLSHFFLMNGVWWYGFLGVGMALSNHLQRPQNTLYQIVSRIDTRFAAPGLLFTWPVLTFGLLSVLSGATYYGLRNRHAYIKYTQVLQHGIEVALSLYYIMTSILSGFSTFPHAPSTLSFKAIHLVYFWIPLAIPVVLGIFAFYRLSVGLKALQSPQPIRALKNKIA